MRQLLVIITLSIGLVGCAASNPATVSTPATVDLNFARTLLAAQTAIDQAKTLVATTPTIKAPLNQVIAGYNSTESAYLLYHQAVATGGTPDPAALTAQITQLSASVASLVQLIGGK